MVIAVIMNNGLLNPKTCYTKNSIQQKDCLLSSTPLNKIDIGPNRIVSVLIIINLTDYYVLTIIKYTKTIVYL